MADDYVRETLRTLRERTGDAYVPLSEVVAYVRGEAGRLGRMGWRDEFGLLSTVAGEIERRWGPKGPQCELCGDTGVVPAEEPGKPDETCEECLRG